MKKIIINKKYDEWTNNRLPINEKYPPVIFILGLPRSGSTLVETILSCNKDAHCLGEYLKLSKTLNNNNLDIYFQNIKHHKILVDKQLSNFKFIPFLINNFQNCKIINMIRNPLDNILSIFLTDIAYTTDYVDTDISLIYNYYKFWKEIMSVWKEKYPNKIYDCYYDKLVQNPEENIKKLINYVGFEWSDNYLNFQKSKNTTVTASTFQVRQGIYKTSSKRWKKYKDYLQDIIKQLKEDGVSFD